MAAILSDGTSPLCPKVPLCLLSCCVAIGRLAVCRASMPGAETATVRACTGLSRPQQADRRAAGGAPRAGRWRLRARLSGRRRRRLLQAISRLVPCGFLLARADSQPLPCLLRPHDARLPLRSLGLCQPLTPSSRAVIVSAAVPAGPATRRRGTRRVSGGKAFIVPGAGSVYRLTLLQRRHHPVLPHAPRAFRVAACGAAGECSPFSRGSGGCRHTRAQHFLRSVVALLCAHCVDRAPVCVCAGGQV